MNGFLLAGGVANVARTTAIASNGALVEVSSSESDGSLMVLTFILVRLGLPARWWPCYGDGTAICCGGVILLWQVHFHRRTVYFFQNIISETLQGNFRWLAMWGSASIYLVEHCAQPIFVISC